MYTKVLVHGYLLTTVINDTNGMDLIKEKKKVIIDLTNLLCLESFPSQIKLSLSLSFQVNSEEE